MPFHDDGEGHNQYDGSDNQQRPTPCAGVGETQSIAAAIERYAASYAADQDKTNRRDRWRLIIETLGLVVLIVAILVAWNQWSAMLDANKKAAQGIDIAQKALDHARQVAESSDKATADSLALTRRSNELAQRAWLSVKEARESPKIAAGSHAEIDIYIENTGRGPAKDIKMIMATRPYRPGWFFTDEIPKPVHDYINIAPMGPSQFRSIHFKFPKPISDADIPLITSGVVVLYYGARLVYNDDFGEGRELAFCFLYNAESRSLRNCLGFNYLR